MSMMLHDDAQSMCPRCGKSAWGYGFMDDHNDLASAKILNRQIATLKL